MHMREEDNGRCGVNRRAKQSTIVLRSDRQSQEAHDGPHDGKSGTERERQRRTIAPGEAKAERRQRRAGGLPN
jgi:hypothetical protein